MNSNEILRLVVKLTGLGVFLSGIIQSASYLPFTLMKLNNANIDINLISELGTFAIPIILGLFLWFFPAPVASTIIKEDIKNKSNNEFIQGLEKIGIRILGLYLLYFGISDLVTNISSYSLDVRMLGENIKFSNKNYTTLFIATGVEIIMSIFLILGSSTISNFINKLYKKYKYAS